MARTLTDATAAALAAETLAPIVMVELYFGSGAVRLWSGIGELVWNTFTWYGVGALGKVGAIEETIEIRAVGAELTLSGVPLDLTAKDGRKLSEIALAEDWQGREANIYLAVLQGRSFDGEPVQIFGGFMDQMRLAERAIVLSCETDLLDLERTKARRWTSADQREEYPEDAGCDAVAALQDVEIKWGRGF